MAPTVSSRVARGRPVSWLGRLRDRRWHGPVIAPEVDGSAPVGRAGTSRLPADRRRRPLPARSGTVARPPTREEPVDIHEALYTTRAMRRVRTDPVPIDVQARILDAAIRAPTGGNAQNWRFLLVDDPAVIAKIGPLYRHSIEQLWETVYADRLADGGGRSRVRSRAFRWSRSSGPPSGWRTTSRRCRCSCSDSCRPTRPGGSIFPAVWSAQLAARAEGLGSSLTVVLGVLPPRRGLRHPRSPPRPALGDGLLRELRLSDRPLGRGPSPTGARGLLPEPVGCSGRVHRRPSAVAAGVGQ